MELHEIAWKNRDGVTWSNICSIGLLCRYGVNAYPSPECAANATKGMNLESKRACAKSVAQLKGVSYGRLFS
jgi:alanine racemase